MSLAVTVLKNSAVLLLFLLFISCGTKNKEYANNAFPYSQFPQEKELKGEVIELDTALFRYPFRIRIEGDKAIVGFAWFRLLWALISIPKFPVSILFR